MSEHFVPAVAVAIVVISASAAKADDLYIWDSRGTQIGTFVYDNLLRRQFTDKIWREVGFWRNGLDANVSFFYTSANCTGQRYFYWNASTLEIPVVSSAYFEKTASSGTPTSSGNTIWGIGADPSPQMVKYGSAWDGHESLGNTPQCYVGDNNNYPMVPAIPLDITSKGFYPPYCAATSATLCK